jgi:alkylation response protein AidB-like acyl-CoA dehydrogenase
VATPIAEKERAPTGDAFLAAARALGGRIAAAGEEIDAAGRLPPWLVDALREAGLFRLTLPRSVGGAETDLLSFLRVAEELARADGSCGWCLVQGAFSASQVVPYLAPAVAREIFGDRRTILANGTGSGGTAVPVDGGYRLSGRWPFASGCTHATWLKAAAPVAEGDGRPGAPAGPPTEDGQSEVRTFLFPAAPEHLVGAWEVSGLRGTGSLTIAVDGLFVPQERTAVLGRDPLREHGPLYRLPYASLAAAGFSAVAMGIARGALDAFVDLAAAKTPRGARQTLREDAVVQAQVSQAEAALRSARAFLHQTAGESYTTVRAGRDLTAGQRALLRLAATYGIHQAAGVVDTVYLAAGATAIFTSQGFERRFRDVHAVTQQTQARPVHFQAVGRYFLGLDVDSSYV